MSDVTKSSMYFIRKYEIPPDHAVVIIGPEGQTYINTAPDIEAGENANISAELIDKVMNNLTDHNATVGQVIFDAFVAVGYTPEQAQEMLEQRHAPTHNGTGEIH